MLRDFTGFPSSLCKAFFKCATEGQAAHLGAVLGGRGGAGFIFTYNLKNLYYCYIFDQSFLFSSAATCSPLSSTEHFSVFQLSTLLFCFSVTAAVCFIGHCLILINSLNTQYQTED